MNTAEFTAGALTCRVKTMPARTQFHVARRFGTILGKLEEIEAARSGGSALAIAGALGETLANLPDEQADYILDACLAAAEVKQSDGLGWAPLRANGLNMYPLDMVGELTIAWHVLKANLAGFTGALSGLGIDVTKIIPSIG